MHSIERGRSDRSLQNQIDIHTLRWAGDLVELKLAVQLSKKE